MKIKKAILTGGGRATRLYPVTTTTNKHLLPLANKPMIFHAIDKVVEAGVKEIFINVNPGEESLQRAIGDGGHWSIQITFFEQTGGPQGIAHVVNEAKKFIGDDSFLFYLSDNIFLGSLIPFFHKFEKEKFDCMLALSHVDDSRFFGVPVFEKDGTLIDVLEKPAYPPNDFAVTGIYLYKSKVFFDAFERIKKSPRGEYEISSIHSLFLKEGKKVGYEEITGWWKDTGKIEDLIIANQLLLDQLDTNKFLIHNVMDSSVVIEGNVHIGIGSQIKKDVILHGPVIIAENCVLESCTIGPYVTVGSGTEIVGATIKNSIILENAEICVPICISDSLLGKKIKLIKKPKGKFQGQRMVIGDNTIVEM